LWSADLTNLESEIRRVEPHADSFHIDVADGRYAPVLLFFPDLLAAIRKKTALPLEVHLITRDPERWIAPFADAGADTIVFYADASGDPARVVEGIKARGLGVGLSLAIEHPVSMAEPFAAELDLAVVLGTSVGVKGIQAPAPGTCEKIRALVELRRDRGLAFEIEADGAIRRETVPPLREAGADIVVPGSLMFKNDPAAVGQWLHSL
jgi:ribulose-phosphate 3-epimerase